MLRAGLVQMDVALGDRDVNLARARRGVDTAVAQGAQMVVLPELWGTGYDTDNWRDTAEPIGTGLFSESAVMAASHKIVLFAGSLLERGGDRLYNTATAWGPDGQLLARYRKRHLFSLMNEDQYLSPGGSPVCVDISLQPEIRAGLGVCYDLRFPGMFRDMALHGAGLLVIPAQWPHPRGLHWARLLQARAIENLAYVLGVNRVGGGKTTQFCGCSMAVDPWGEILAEGSESDETVIIVDIDPERVRTAREALPVLRDSRESGDR